ncbi:multicopper oxidase domain-containing protein [Roseomonas sp. E05]|uniref:multicopper oxidase family protein n=1 Tax=Roseomonas sp. E05 TaxID=3046310 RepID=UPI0024B8C635|nr:multicopper oxidase domain-containing protein [Roseomonas sp. E05]MDJ0391011.1 multicopper oxidase domain-containing protein [Roseomonas sp. E05]
MTIKLTRRGLLATASAASTFALGGGARVRAQPAAPIRLAAERRTLDINGKAATVFGLRQPDGSPGISLASGQRFLVELANQTSEETIVHWHGQTPPVRQDGVADTGLEALIPPGSRQAYDYAARPGTHWMHSHHGLQEQILMAAPLVVRTAEDARADLQEVVVLLHDFTFRDPREILAGLTGAADAARAAQAMPGGATSGLPMGSGHMEGMPTGGHAMSGMSMGGHAQAPMAAMPGGRSTARTGMVMDLNDIDYDAYLANDRTLADPVVVRTERKGRVRLRLINGATSTAFWLDLGALEGTIVAVDGNPVRPLAARQFPIAQGQRVDVVLQMPSSGGAFPVLAQREGDRQRTGIILATPGARVEKVAEAAGQAVGAVDLSLERRLQAMQPLAPRRADIVHRIALTGMMQPYRWGIDGRTWAHGQPLVVSQGWRVEVEMVNRSQMAHPMHLHGHHFQVLALNGTPIAGAMRDTVLVPVHGSVRVAFDADNPGRWLFHCHNLYHMATGMMTELAYSDFV